jgi:hypothetical protein
MADLPCEVEDDVGISDDIGARCIADGGSEDVDSRRYVARVTAVAVDERVDDPNLGTFAEQVMHEVGTQKPQPSRDHHELIGPMPPVR